jgi:hypothetical protein
VAAIVAMIPAVYVGMPNAGAVLFLASVQSAFTPVNNNGKKSLTRSASVGTLVGGEDMSMGDVWAEVEWMRRKLDENRIEMLDVIERQKKLNGPEVAGEYESLEGKFNELIKREDMLRAELARLITIAVRQRLRGGVGSREDKGHLGWFV